MKIMKDHRPNLVGLEGVKVSWKDEGMILPVEEKQSAII